jgi:hypothetical protein
MPLTESDQLRYPVGRFTFPGKVSEEEIKSLLKILEELPVRLENAVKGMTQEQLNTSYREGGWTVRQVVHHLFDSHVNAYIRMKLAVTENVPTIKPYDQDKWSDLEDARTARVEISLRLLNDLHRRWLIFLKSIPGQSWERTFYHPEQKREISLAQTLALYAWHSRHHLAHITELKKRMEW